MKIHIVSGFLGAGKTTFIKKWIPLLDGKVCLIENEFGDVSIDSNLFPHTLEVKEIYSGCICCNLVGDFIEGIKELYEIHHPDHLIIEPSGVGALSEVLKVCRRSIALYPEAMALGNVCTLVDVTAFSDYVDNFGGFYTDQIMSAPQVFLSYLKDVEHTALSRILREIQEITPKGQIIYEEWITMEDAEFDAHMNLYGDGRYELPKDRMLPLAEQLLSSFSIRRPKVFSLENFVQLFNGLDNLSAGQLIRSKGVIKLMTGEHVHFDYTPFHREWRYIEDTVEPGIAFIGSAIDERILRKSFSKSVVIKNAKGGLSNEVSGL